MFFSIHNCDKHPEVPLMQMKTCTEKYLADSGLNYTIFRLCGFMQVCVSSLHLCLHICTLFQKSLAHGCPVVALMNFGIDMFAGNQGSSMIAACMLS